MDRHSFRSSVRRIASILIMALVGTLGVAGPAGAQQTYPFRDPDLPLQTRIDDLLGRLILDEKIAFLHQYQPEIPRLGIRLNKNGTEALHGLAWTNHYETGDVVTATATVFPQAVGLASTWDPALVKQVGSAVGTEARGYNKENPRVWGLNVWSPVVDPLRDPRWGRNEEGYSEDPYLAGTTATAYAGGLRGDHPRYLRTAPTLKHYTGYNNEIRRDTTSSNLRPRVRHEYSDVPFRMPISADAATGVMTAYNLVNGHPMTAHPDAGDEVRSWTDETLMNVTDAFAPNNLTGSQGYFATQSEANAAVLKAGVDSFTQDGNNPEATLAAIREALDQGLLTEADIDTAVRHVLSIRFRLGEFDPGGGPYGNTTKDVVNSPAHQRLARRAAAEAMVLLRNSASDGGGALPLNASETRKVAVVGPLADTLYTDWYSGAMPYEVTPLRGIRERLGAGGTVTSSEGVDRIALKAPNGRYVTAPSADAGGPLAATGDSAGDAQQLDVFDWGEGIVTLRTVANGKYVSFGPDRTMVNNADQPNGWFVQQQFELVEHGDGYLLEYAGNEVDDSWFGDQKYVVAGDDGTLTVTASTPEDATTFTKEVITSGVEDAVRAARGADAAVVVVGSMPFINGREDDDRQRMSLAEAQEELVAAVREANPNTVVVLENSYPTTTNRLPQNVPAILWTTHAGQETGRALADALFGDRNPAGRLTQTWYRSEDDLPDILDYDIIKTDRTYLYFQGDPLYPFGHGLSYTTFDYRDLRLSSGSVRGNGKVTVSVDVANTGARAGDEVVQLYTHQRTSRDKQPLRKLRGFQRVHLKPGQTKTVRLPLRAADLAHWDVTRGRRVVESSVHDILVGASSADIRERTVLRVRGETIPPRDLRERTRAVDFDDYQGIELVDESKARGDAVGASAGGWIEFADADLRSGPATLTARTAKASAGDAAIEIRLDDPGNGPVLGTAQVASTGDRYTYATTTAQLEGVSGRRDVYLVFTGDLRLATFSLR
ncbi:MAG: carbohydrate-binding protein [Streptosporangiales bacterium]|nr:carbohydrate-binding protein [Streptosporangiales bacterium]